MCTVVRDTFLLHNQLGFKKKDGTNICIFTLQEVVATWVSMNLTAFQFFLDASNACVTPAYNKYGLIRREMCCKKESCRLGRRGRTKMTFPVSHVCKSACEAVKYIGRR